MPLLAVRLTGPPGDCRPGATAGHGDYPFRICDTAGSNRIVLVLEDLIAHGEQIASRSNMVAPHMPVWAAG